MTATRTLRALATTLGIVVAGLALQLVQPLAPYAYAADLSSVTVGAEGAGGAEVLSGSGSIIPFCPTCSTSGNYMEPQPPMPGVDLGVRFFFWNTAHGYLYAIINALIRVVAVVLLIVYLYAGILWMTSLGTDRVSKAKSLIIDATIGLVVILLSSAIIRVLMTLKSF